MGERRRTLLVSIDGACWAYLDPLLAEGRLPELAALLHAGVHGGLESLLPPLTPVAWAALLSGKASGKNGIYDWVRPIADEGAFQPVGASDLVGAPIWQWLNAAGVRVGLVNVPLTYPPPCLDGFVIGGFMMPDDAASHCYPAVLQAELDARFAPYLANVPAAVMEGGDPHTLSEVSRRVQAGQVAAAIESAARYPVDLLVVNLMLFDQVNHFEPNLEAVTRTLAYCDADLGVLRRGFEPDTVLLFSDHGTRRVDGTFLLGRWLAERGYQSWPSLPAERRGHINCLIGAVTQEQLRWTGNAERLARRALVVSWEHAPALIEGWLWRMLQRWVHIDSQRHWLHPRPDAQGSAVWAGSLNGCLYVDPFVPSSTRRAAIAERLIRELCDLRDPHSGAPLFALSDGRAVYGEAAVGSPPDLLLDCTDSRWNLSMALPPTMLVRERYFVEHTAGRYGEHAREGIFVFSGDGIRVDPVRGHAKLLDLAATILHLYDVAIPADYDSRPMTDALEPELLRRQPVRVQPGEAADARSRAAAETVVSADLEQRLRRLGYIE